MDRHMQLLRPEVLAAHARVIAMPVETRRTRARAQENIVNNDSENNTESNNAENALQTATETPQELEGVNTIVGELPDEMADWDATIQRDDEYQAIRKAVEARERKMPPEYKLKVSITEYSISP